MQSDKNSPTSPSDRLKWNLGSQVSVGRYQIPCPDSLEPGFNQGSGIKRDAGLKKAIKPWLWPFFKLKADLLHDGFIEREAGGRIRKYIDVNSTFLEIGCGDMSLIRYLPPGITYNAFDLQLSEFHVRRVLRHGARTNIAVASAKNIPLESNVADLLVSTETLEHIPDVERAIKEIYRVSCQHAIFICTIPNNYCKKYKVKGAHEGHINNWTLAEFTTQMNRHGFETIEATMIGWWVPLPRWVTRQSYQLPIRHREEFLNTNFVCVFRVLK